MDPGMSERKMFRESAVREYLTGREASVIPAFTGSGVTTVLWGVSALIVMGMAFFAVSMKVPQYQATPVLVVGEQASPTIVMPAWDEAEGPREFLLTTDADGVPEPWTVVQTRGRDFPSGEVAGMYGIPVEMLAQIGADRYSVVAAEPRDTAATDADLSAGLYPALVESGQRTLFDVLIGAE